MTCKTGIVSPVRDYAHWNTADCIDNTEGQINVSVLVKNCNQHLFS